MVPPPHTHTNKYTQRQWQGYMHRSAAAVSMVTAWSTSQSSDCKRGAPPKSSPKIMRIYGPNPRDTHNNSSGVQTIAGITNPPTDVVHACFTLITGIAHNVSYYTLITFRDSLKLFVGTMSS